jgi:hypothetical protein
MATALHPELVVGNDGVGKPRPLLLGMQHLKLTGPGHLFVSVMPKEQEDVKWQFPALEVPHLVFVQHLMSIGVPGQVLEIYRHASSD